MQPVCVVKQRLFESYTEAAAALAEIGKRISDRSNTDVNGTFDTLWAECEAARERCIQIRRQISAHAQIHGCGMFK